MELIDDVLLVVFILALGFCFAILGYMIGNLEELPFNIGERSIEYTSNNFSHCENLSLEDSVFCVRDTTRSFFNYTLRDENLYKGNDGSLEDVIKNGGDCHDYTNIYEETFESFGFNTKRVLIKGDEVIDGRTKAHVFLIVYDPITFEYCHVDQMIVNCITTKA